MNRLSPHKQADILGNMMERMPMRGLARNAPGNSKRRRNGVSINTVLKLLADAGDAAILFLDATIHSPKTTLVEADEVYCIVKVKPGTLRKRGVRVRGLGAVWLWIAIDVRTKLVVAWHLGGREGEDAAALMQDLSGRVPGRIQLTTDSLAAYEEAVSDAFDEIDYAAVKKRDAEEEAARLQAELAGKPYRPPRRTTAAKKEMEPPRIVLGEPDLDFATTNHIEAFFTQLRKALARMSRRSTMISKSVENLRRAIALYIVHHNFIKLHHSLGGKTPAQAAGLDPKKWEWDDFINVLDDFWETRREEKRAAKERGGEHGEAEAVPTDIVVPSSRPGEYCVYYATVAKYARVHRSDCPHLRTKPERRGSGTYGRKFYCDTLEQARNQAAALARGRASECKLCLGEINSPEYLNPRNTTHQRRLT